MITVTQAEQLILKHHLSLGTESVPLINAYNRTTAEPISADRPFPPFDRVTMDGIAIKYEGWNSGLRKFVVKSVQAAGSPPEQLGHPGNCIEVMTGAVLPIGSDTVIPYEHLRKLTTEYQVLEGPNSGQNVHREGSDRHQGNQIVPRGSVLGAPEIGVAATVGKSLVKVVALPQIAIISTGDELVGIAETPLPHQIRSSNAHTLARALWHWGIQPQLHHLVDDLKGTKNRLKSLLKKYPILILSGGVSKGKFDLVPQALEELGVNKEFHRIGQRPGKPFWFGHHPESKNLIFAFPGNPVSSFMCFIRYFKPWMNRELGYPVDPLHAVLKKEINFTPDLTYFAQVKIEFSGEHCCAWPVEGHGSGDLANLVDADGFLELPAHKKQFKQGEIYPVHLYRDL